LAWRRRFGRRQASLPTVRKAETFGIVHEVSMDMARRTRRVRPKHEAGQDAAEYALLMVIVVFFLLLGMAVLGDALLVVWENLASHFPF
jgi:Flp pilus assembly pilin Flp